MCVMGDFGRTPKVNGNGAGRDHWNFCYSLVLAGGGVKGGLRPRRERQDRRQAEPQPGDAGRHHRDDLRMPRRPARPGTPRPPRPPVRLVPVGEPDPGVDWVRYWSQFRRAFSQQMEMDLGCRDHVVSPPSDHARQSRPPGARARISPSCLWSRKVGARNNGNRCSRQFDPGIDSLISHRTLRARLSSLMAC